MNLNARINRIEERAGLGRQWPFVLKLLEESEGGMTPEQEREFESCMQRDRQLSAFLERLAMAEPA
jgi:hypothetical protein